MMERYASEPDFLARGDKYTFHDVLRVQEEAARLQAEVNAQVMTALVGGLVRAVRWTATGIAHVLREQWVSVAAYRLHNELRRFSDRQLAQLGITRDEIASYVASVAGAKPAGQPVALQAIDGGRIAGEIDQQDEPVRRRAA